MCTSCFPLAPKWRPWQNAVHAKAVGCHAGLSGFCTAFTGSEPGKPSPNPTHTYPGSLRLSPGAKDLPSNPKPAPATPTCCILPGQPACDHRNPSVWPPPRRNVALRPRPSLGSPMLALSMRTGCGDSRYSTYGHRATQVSFIQHNLFFRCPSFNLLSSKPGQIVHPQISVPCS